MSGVEERCMHQGVDSGPHALFKEKWERCKNCAYDLENNRRCPDYVPTCSSPSSEYYKSMISYPSQKREDIRA